MKKPQVQRILDKLGDGLWHCTSEFYADYMADPRRRMVDIKEKGFELESRPCRTHSYHDGGSKEWRLKSVLEKKASQLVYDPVNDRMVYAKS